MKLYEIQNRSQKIIIFVYLNCCLLDTITQKQISSNPTIPGLSLPSADIHTEPYTDNLEVLTGAYFPTLYLSLVPTSDKLNQVERLQADNLQISFSRLTPLEKHRCMKRDHYLGENFKKTIAAAYLL